MATKTKSGFWALSKNQLTVIVDGVSYIVEKTAKNFDKVFALAKAGKWDEIVTALNVVASVTNFSKGEVQILGDKVVYNGEELHSYMAQKLLEVFRSGEDYEPFRKFVGRVLANPSRTSREELYLFLEKSNLPITPDGCFLAYRKVDKNYLSIHANPDGSRNSNKVGDVVTMDRREVDDNRNRTCSVGLHFASFSYMGSYGSSSNEDRIVIVKIDPADVVSIPSDYDNAKGRCCKYEVVAEHTQKSVPNDMEKSAVFDYSVDWESVDEEIDEEFEDEEFLEQTTGGVTFWNKRDPHTGRFLPKKK